MGSSINQRFASIEGHFLLIVFFFTLIYNILNILFQIKYAKKQKVKFLLITSKVSEIPCQKKKTHLQKETTNHELN